jgi:hypothetical protein
MPGAAPQPEINAAYAERFAALWAGADTGNANDAESSGKWRELRRMAKAVDLRVIDLAGRAVVVRALDAQLMPPRELSPELAEARALIETLRQDNAQLEKDGAALALALKRQEEINGDLRRRSGAARQGSSAAPCPARASDPARECAGGLLAFAAVMAVAALLFVVAARIAAAVFGGG